MTEAEADQEVWIVPAGDDVVVVTDRGRASAEQAPGLDPRLLLKGAGDLFTVAKAVLGEGGSVLYELSPESQEQLKKLSKNHVGGYFRGVLRRQDGTAGHQLQLREAPSSPPDLQNLMLAAQLHAMQVQLDRIEDLVRDVLRSVAEVTTFLQEHQRAEIVAVLNMVTEAYERAQRAGRLGSIDWERLAGVELVLETQLRHVGQEIDGRLESFGMPSTPKELAAAHDGLNSARVRDLFGRYGALVIARSRWQELVVLRKQQANELDAEEVAAFADRLKGLAADATTRLDRVAQIIEQAATVEPRSWTRIFWDGLVAGARNDRKHLQSAGEHLVVLNQVRRSSTLRVTAAKPSLSIEPPLATEEVGE